ncbi:MAG: glycosyltransferase [Acidobacteriota bacterium]
MISGSEKRISVLVPSYNHAKFVDRCLRSILSQTHPPSELLVIDDGSTDGSPAVIENILKSCPFPCELIVNSNQGLCATLNEGLGRTTGEYFAYLGSDDLWLPEFLGSRIDLLESRPEAVLAYGNGYLIDDTDDIFESSADWRNFEFPDGDARPMLYLGTAPISSTVFYRRDALEEIGWNEGSRLEDYELYLRLAEVGAFAFDPSVLGAWRRHDTNTSGDLDFMLDQVIAAQKRVAPKLDWSAGKLWEIQTRTRFFFSEEYGRAGEKAKSRSLLFGNIAGAPSFRIFLRAIVRNLIPEAVLKRRKRYVRARKIAQYGSVQTS